MHTCIHTRILYAQYPGTHSHTHAQKELYSHIYIYIYIHREREREHVNWYTLWMYRYSCASQYMTASCHGHVSVISMPDQESYMTSMHTCKHTYKFIIRTWITIQMWACTKTQMHTQSYSHTHVFQEPSQRPCGYRQHARSRIIRMEQRRGNRPSKTYVCQRAHRMSWLRKRYVHIGLVERALCSHRPCWEGAVLT